MSNLNHPKSPIKVFVLEDQQVFIDGLKTYFQMVPYIQYVGSATSAEQCLTMIKNKPIDVLLLDIKIRQDDMAGFKVAEAVLKFPTPPVIVFLSEHSHKMYISKAMEMGCSFVEKYMQMADIIEVIVTAHEKKKGHHQSGRD